MSEEQLLLANREHSDKSEYLRTSPLFTTDTSWMSCRWSQELWKQGNEATNSYEGLTKEFGPLLPCRKAPFNTASIMTRT